MSLQKKNVILRSLTIAVFLLGVLLIFNFVSFYNRATAREDIVYGSVEELIEADRELLDHGVIGIAVNYYLYVAAACLAFVLSIKFAKITGRITTILRTVFIGIATVCSFGGTVIIRVLFMLRKIFETIDFELPETYHNVGQAVEEVVNGVDIDTAVIGMLLVIVSVINFYFLTITASVGLIIKSQKEQNSV